MVNKNIKALTFSVLIGAFALLPLGTVNLARAQTYDTVNSMLYDVMVANLSDTSATISWNSSPADYSYLNYGTANTSAGRNLNAQDLSVQTMDHTLNLTGLMPNTTYYFHIVSNSQSASPLESQDYSFMTLPSGMVSLTVATVGGGKGTISGGSNTSSTSLECGPTCSFNFPRGTAVTLNVSPDSNSILAGWSGCAIKADGSCAVTLNQSQTVYAELGLVMPTAVAPTPMVTTPEPASSPDLTSLNAEFEQALTTIQNDWNQKELMLNNNKPEANDADSTLIKNLIKQIQMNWSQEK